LVDALEADGMVVREKHPTDRRKTVVRLNDHAADRARAARADRADGLAPLFEGIPKSDRIAFARVAETLLDRAAAGVSSGPSSSADRESES
ncbi:MAG: hypothetical protein WBA25_14735, partial [Jannaschia sp.]